MLRYETGRTWFSHLLQHPVRNGVDLFSQPRSPHEAASLHKYESASNKNLLVLLTLQYDSILTGHKNVAARHTCRPASNIILSLKKKNNYLPHLLLSSVTKQDHCPSGITSHQKTALITECVYVSVMKYSSF